ncbi:uncharacterized protein ZK546.14-like [Aphidius gifuensis]|uniref:uncharacterized protein ZK546.14-like n=1 Tax=Aphidius gifuensis TaxID=684658 RepID=UPI001CDD04A1|nr:uncharacterized protein ZK546.14-like [Aphidius gifuensis]
MESPSGSGLSIAEIDALSLDELRLKLEDIKKSTKGSRAVLVERLRKALKGPGDKDKNKESTSSTDKNSNDKTDESDSQSDGVDDRFIDEMSKLQLKDELKKRGLSRCGRSAELRERLRKAYLTQVTSSEEDESDDDDRRPRRMARNNREDEKPLVRLDEVMESLEKFSGEKGENLKQWLDRFLQLAEEYRWSDLYKKIYAERLLQGAALLFMKSVHAKTWARWKELLMEEFADSMDSGKVHQQLATIDKKKDETYLAYVYRASEIASHAPGIETSVIIRYIIAGIKDDEAHKAVLYGAKTIKELREKIKLYEELKTNSQKSKVQKKVLENEKTKKTNVEDEKNEDRRMKSCYGCGNVGHRAIDCPEKSKGRKCFRCHEFGHIGIECKKVVDNKSDEAKPKVRVDKLDQTDRKTYKDVTVLGQSVKAIIDSGSDLHIARASLYVRLGAPPLEQKKLIFSGMGSSNMCTLGRFKTNVEIDGFCFPLNIDIVPDEWMGYDFLIGGELSELAEISWMN